MGIFNRFGSQFVDIIEWTQTDRETMVYRFPRYNNEIKYGAKMTVREGQMAVFVNEGKIADVFPPGIYELETANLPILTNLQNWQHGFNSPFKAEVYFFNTTDLMNLKWGTKQPITVNDQQFGLVRMRAFGSFTTKIKQPDVFLRKVVGTDGHVEIDEIGDELGRAVISKFNEVLAESNTSIATVAAELSELSAKISEAIAPDFAHYGLEVGKIYIESVSLPDAVQAALDEKSSMSILGEDMSKYTEYKAAQSLDKGQGGGAVGAGVGMAVGMEMAKKISQQNQSQDHSPSNTDSSVEGMPPLPEQGEYYVMHFTDRLGPMNLDEVYQRITRGEFGVDSLIWRKGMKEWVPIDELNEFDATQIPPKI